MSANQTTAQPRATPAGVEISRQALYRRARADPFFASFAPREPARVIFVERQRSTASRWTGP